MEEIVEQRHIKYFLRKSRFFVHLFYSSSFLLLFITIYLIIFAPEDYQQKLSVKIMYIHVPAAWIALFCYFMMSLAALLYIYKKNIFAATFLKASAPLGTLFTALALITGSLWGQMSWGSWWEWDARLTSFLILFFIYILILAFTYAFYDQEKARYATALLTIFGSINLPIIKFSVTWWRSLHQPASLFTKKGAMIDAPLLWPLLFSALALTLLFFAWQLTHMRILLYQERLSFLREKLYKKLNTRPDRKKENTHDQ